MEKHELRFCRGDVINVLAWINPEWCKGELDGRTGVFPAILVTDLASLLEDFQKHNNGNFGLHNSIHFAGNLLVIVV